MWTAAAARRLASDLITREIERIGKKKPVLAYMGNVAASGGYHVSALAKHIMSQSGTITGSIGVMMMRLHTQGLYENLSVNRASFQRGQRAGLYSDEAPLTEDETARFTQASRKHTIILSGWWPTAVPSLTTTSIPSAKGGCGAGGKR